MKKHLSIVPDSTEEEDVDVDPNTATITALRQIAERAPLGGKGQWETDEMVALFDACLTAEKKTPLSLNEMEAALDIPGLAHAVLEWETWSVS